MVKEPASAPPPVTVPRKLKVTLSIPVKEVPVPVKSEPFCPLIDYGFFVDRFRELGTKDSPKSFAGSSSWLESR